MSELPKGWARAELGTVCTLLNGRAYKRSELLAAGKYPVLRVGNFFTSQTWYYSDLELDSDKYCSGGDLLYAWSASFGPKIWSGEKVIYHYHIWRVDVLDAILEKRFLYNWFNWDKENIKAAHGTGSTMIHVTKGDMEKRLVALPPLAEQKRIVAKLDALSARSARAREALDRIETLVKRYKQAVLSKAFSGELTKNVDVNLNVIEADNGSHVAALWPVPNTWTWCRTDQVGHVGLGRQRSPKNHTGPQMRPYLRSANITWHGIDTNDVKEMNFDDSDFKRFQLEDGDVLLNEGSGSPTEVGKPTIWRGEIADCCYQNTLLRVQPSQCSSEYLYYYFLLTARAGRFVASTQGVNIQHIGRQGLANFPVPLAPETEQKEIVRRIESAFQKIDRLAAEAKRALELTDKLDEAILAKAFRGELVPQDPNDEPASVLLDRIKAERAAQPKPKRGRGKKA